MRLTLVACMASVTTRVPAEVIPNSALVLDTRSAPRQLPTSGRPRVPESLGSCGLDGAGCSGFGRAL
jgi:hypothetical protein